MKNQQMASIKVENPDKGHYLPTNGLGNVIKLNRKSGSLIIGHNFEFTPTPEPVGTEFETELVIFSYDKFFLCMKFLVCSYILDCVLNSR